MFRGRRVLLSTFGSAGDVFPLIPIARRLLDEGHEVMFAAPRSLGLYLRALGLPALGLGNGSELGVVNDSAMFTTRFGGWCSFRRIFTNYVAPGLRMQTEQVESLLDDWRPDVVVTMNYATAARLATLRKRVPHVGMSIYPQFSRLGREHGGGFAPAYQEQVRALCPREVLDEAGFGAVAWGADPRAVLLADPALVSPDALPAGSECVGYPYWDALPSRPGEAERAETWLRERPEDVVAVTLGSFVGAAPSTIWRAVRDVVAGCGVRAVVVNARVGDALDAEVAAQRVLSIGFVPMSALLGGVAGVVHHGGVGTTYGALRFGLPAVIVPQAFDQPFVAEAARRAGVAVPASTETLRTAVETMLDPNGIRTTSARVASQLIPAAVAAQRAADLILTRADEVRSVPV